MRRNGSLFKEIYNNGYDGFNRELVNIAFMGTWKKFSILAEGKTISTKTLKLKKENKTIDFSFNRNKTNEFDTFIATNNENNKTTFMNFNLMCNLIELSLLNGYEVITD